MNATFRRLIAGLCVSAAPTAVCADQGGSPFPTSTGLYGAAIPAAPDAGNNLVGYGGVPAGAPVLRWPNQGYSSSYQRSAREEAIAKGVGQGFAQLLLLPVMVIATPVLLPAAVVKLAVSKADAARPQEHGVETIVHEVSSSTREER